MPPPFNATEAAAAATATNTRSRSLQLAPVSSDSVAVELQLGGALDLLGQQLWVGAVQGAVSDLAYNEMRAELTLAGDVVASSDGGVAGGLLPLASAGAVGAGPVALPAVGATASMVAACVVGGLLALICCHCLLLAIRRWRRHRQQATVIKQHVAELHETILAAPSDGSLAREVRELGALAATPWDHRVTGGEWLRAVSAHITRKTSALELTTAAPPVRCGCDVCGQLAPVAQEVFEATFGIAPSHHLDAVQWTRSLYDEIEMPPERFDLCVLPAAIALAAFSFDESIFTHESSAKLIVQLRDAVDGAVLHPTHLPLCVLDVGRLLFRSHHPAEPPPTELQAVEALQVGLRGGDMQFPQDVAASGAMRPAPVFRSTVTTHHPPPRRSAPVLQRVGDGVALALAAHASDELNDAPLDLWKFPAALLLAAALQELHALRDNKEAMYRASLAEGTFQEMLRRLSRTLGEHAEADENAAPLPTAVLQTAQELWLLRHSRSSAKHGMAPMASEVNEVSLLHRSLADARSDAPAEPTLRPHAHTTLVRTCNLLFRDVMGRVPLSLKLAALQQQLDACIPECTAMRDDDRRTSVTHSANQLALVQTLSRLGSAVSAVETDALLGQTAPSFLVSAPRVRSSTDALHRSFRAESVALNRPSSRMSRRSRAARVTPENLSSGCAAVVEMGMGAKSSSRQAGLNLPGVTAAVASDDTHAQQYDVEAEDDAEGDLDGLPPNLDTPPDFDQRHSSCIIGFTVGDDDEEEELVELPKALAAPPEPLRRQTTAEELDELRQRAEDEVAERCIHVRLNFERRRIELLAPIRFHGSKFEGGVDVFLEPALAKAICDEIGTAYEICNDLLHSLSLPPLGLRLDGHTSASIHGPKESVHISTLRARQCERAVKRFLMLKHRGALTLWGQPLFLLLAHWGYGDTRPLPGFTDGNYPENRRVEVCLLDVDGEGYLAPPQPIWERLGEGGGSKAADRTLAASKITRPDRPTSNFATPHFKGPQAERERQTSAAYACGPGLPPKMWTAASQHDATPFAGAGADAGACGRVSLPSSHLHQQRPTSASRSDQYLRNQRCFLPLPIPLSLTRERPERNNRRFRVVSECVLASLPLKQGGDGKGGGGVCVRPLELIERMHLVEEPLSMHPTPLLRADDLTAELLHGHLLSAASRIQTWVRRFLSARMDDSRRISRRLSRRFSSTSSAAVHYSVELDSESTAVHSSGGRLSLSCGRDS